MSRVAKFLTGGVLFLILIIALFVMGLRSCLSKYDERSAMPPTVYVEKDNQAVLFSIVQFSKTTSYSRSGSMTHKSVNDEYYVQSNDAIAGKKLLAKEVELPSRPTQFPIEILGVSDTKVWVFINELRAFDAFSLQELMDIERIEEKNPSVKGKMPAERRYYEFDKKTGNIKFKGSDGAPWVLDSKTFLVQAIDESKETPETRDELAARVQSLAKINIHFSQIKLNQDTISGRWFGIYAPDEWQDLQERVTIGQLNGADKRRQFIGTTYDSVADYKRFVIEKNSASTFSSAGYFLEGGFLTDKNTGLALRLSQPQGYLLVYKEQIGYEGKIILGRISLDGKLLWSFNTGLREWSDWQLHGPRLYIFGVDKKELSSSEVNVVHIVTLATGKVNSYDFFDDKEK